MLLCLFSFFLGGDLLSGTAVLHSRGTKRLALPAPASGSVGAVNPLAGIATQLAWRNPAIPGHSSTTLFRVLV